MKYVELASGEKVPALGLGAWKMCVGDSDEAAQLRALQAGIARGMTLIDTAEMYGDGRSEQLVAKVIAGQRNKVFVVSKVLPSNASRKGTLKAREASLRHLKTDVLDLYLMHWRGIEFDLHPKCQTDRIAVMAYCPLGQGRLTNNPGLAPIAEKHNVTNAGIALPFTLRLPGMISIPKSSHEKRVLENFAAADLVLDDEDLAKLDELFPPSRRKRPLAMN